MSTKKKLFYDMAWQQLLAMCAWQRRPVSAGEFAVRLGVARSTAKRYLEEMVSAGAVVVETVTGKNHLQMSVYEPEGRQERWNYREFTDVEMNEFPF